MSILMHSGEFDCSAALNRLNILQRDQAFLQQGKGSRALSTIVLIERFVLLAAALPQTPRCRAPYGTTPKCKTSAA